MCRLRNIAMRDYQESVTTGQTDGRKDRQTDPGQSEPHVPLHFAGDKIILLNCMIKGKPFIHILLILMNFCQLQHRLLW